MTETRTCADCGSVLDADGLCRRCLLKLGIEGASEGETATAPPRDPKEGLETIGPYHLLSLLGEGGMGVVYLAEQREPIRRRVALKVIRRGMDSREVIARFESERQALALMSHPNIARVLDAGKTEAGLPFFVMEYVPGIPLTDYCDRHRLDAADRLKLFVSVCQAVQHAHQKGVIHRDIKPSNVLVSLEDETPQPKVIDFGVAKAVNQRLTEKTLFTEQGILVGTPGYMSPEQAEMSALDIDTRTDIYSLGVLLYELMVGALPFDAQRLRRAGYLEMQRIIREEEPPRPSTKVSGLGATATEVADRRRTDPRSLERQLRGDLDWISLKALEKDRTRRYQSATELAQDVQRHLAGEPVTAGRPNAAYRFRKLVRRHRILFAAASAVFLALLAGAIVSTVQYLRAEKARKENRSQLVRLYVENGMRLAQEEDFFGALPWLAGALRLEERGQRAKEVHRYRIGSVLENAPRLARLWAYNGMWAAELSPDGARVAAAGQDGTARVWPVDPPESPGVVIRHSAPIHWIRFAPDSRRVVTFSSDKTARIWDTETGRPLTPPLFHDDEVLSGSFGGDGLLVATACADGTARTWEADSGRLVTTVRHGGPLIDAWLSPDGKRLLTTGEDGIAILWNPRTGQRLAPPLRHRGGITTAEFSPDGKRVATGSWDFTARIWDAATGAPLSPFLGHANPLVRVGFSADGRWLATAAAEPQTRVWDGRTGEPVSPPLQHADTVLYAGFSADSLSLITCSGDGKVQIWDTATWSKTGPPLRHGYPFNAVFAQRGRRLFTAGLDGVVRMWDLAGSAPRYPELKHAAQVVRIGFPPDGKTLAAAVGLQAKPPGYVQIWDPVAGEPLAPPLRHSAATLAFAFDRAGARIATGSRDGSARLWDAATGEPLLPPLRHPGWVNAVAVSSDAQHLLAGFGSLPLGQSPIEKPGGAWIWDVASGRVVGRPMTHEKSVRTAVFSPDGRRILTASNDGSGRLWDAATGSSAGPPLRHEREVQKAVFSPDGSRVATASRDGGVSLWETVTGRRIAALPQGAETTDVTFSGDGRRLITATTDGLSSIWDVQTGARLGAPLEHGGFGYSARFSPDGRWAITAGLNRTARIWDASDGLAVSPPIRHRDSVWQADFSPDGTRFATACQDGTVRLWDFRKSSEPENELESLGILLAGRRLDAKNGQFQLDPAEIESTWKRLRRSTPQIFEAPDEKVLAWHRQRAADLLSARRWANAVPLLDELIAAAPGSRSARALRGTAYAELGKLEAAAEDFAEAWKLRPDDSETAYELALLRLALGRVEDYRDLRRLLLQRHGSTRNPDRAEWIARTAVLLPADDPRAAGVAVRLAETALEIQPAEPTVVALHRVALMRANRPVTPFATRAAPDASATPATWRERHEQKLLAPSARQ